MHQDYQAYTSEDHEVWSILYGRQLECINDKASEAYLEGIQKCGFRSHAIPDFTNVNIRLDKATGWQIYVVPGLIDNLPFFKHLSKKEFPATTWLRTKAQLDYLEEPDMFHDIFGHIPLLSEPMFCEYLQAISSITSKYIQDPLAVEYMARLYWYTVEFGLIKEKNAIKIYGAGILSSLGESVYCLSDAAQYLPFNVSTIFSYPYIKDKYQEQYFVIDSYDQLFESIKTIEPTLQAYLGLSRKEVA